MNQRKRWRLAFCIAVLILAAIGCDLGEVDDAIDQVSCGTLVMICGDVEHTVMVWARELTQNVEGDIRYFRFYDCGMGEWLQSSCDADCTLEVR